MGTVLASALATDIEQHGARLAIGRHDLILGILTGYDLGDVLDLDRPAVGFGHFHIGDLVHRFDARVGDGEKQLLVFLVQPGGADEDFLSEAHR